MPEPFVVDGNEFDSMADVKKYLEDVMEDDWFERETHELRYVVERGDKYYYPVVRIKVLRLEKH